MKHGQQPTVVGDFKDNSPEWHAARATGLGGSDMAAILGLSPWTSKFTLYHQKSGNLPPMEETDLLRWGHILEGPIRQHWIETKMPEGKVLTTGRTFRHPEHEWLVCNPDGLVWDGAEYEGIPEVLEIKNSGRPDGWGPDGTSLIPVYYSVQVASYMAVMDADVAYLHVLIGGNDARTYTIERDEDDIEFILEKGAEFWRDIQEGNEPDLDTSSSTYTTLRTTHPAIEDERVVVDEDLARDYLSAVESRKMWEVEERGLKSKVMREMGMARWAVTQEGISVATRVAPRSAEGVPWLRASTGSLAKFKDAPLREMAS